MIWGEPLKRRGSGRKSRDLSPVQADVDLSRFMASPGSIEAKNFTAPKATQEKREEIKHGSRIRSVTVNLVATYQQCCNDFGYSETHAPRRVLTKLSKGVYNANYDNAEHDYICRVGDKIVNPDGHPYEILERLGHGTFGQVLKCHHSASNGPVALKIIKNKPAYFHQALVEVRILQMLNQEFDPDDEKRIVRMLDFFVYRKHLCIAFELLSVNLYEVLKQNSFRGVSMALIRVLTDQLLKALRCLREASVIHCDLKPENVLLSNIHHTRIKLIDFGSACFESHTVYPYIQSRFYRSPEVLLGVPYTSAIDMWSLGCICAELFLGLPVFPGHSEYDQVCRMVEVLNMPPTSLLDAGRNTKRYFRKEELKLPEGAEGPSTSSADGEQDLIDTHDRRETHSQSSCSGGDSPSESRVKAPEAAEAPSTAAATTVEATTVEATTVEDDSRVYMVSGAGGVGSPCNGEYRRQGDMNEKPLYKKTGGSAIIYFQSRWKMNSTDSTRGWYYLGPDVPAATPPEGQWTTEGYSKDDANPAPVVSTYKAKSSFLDLLKHRLGIADDGETPEKMPEAEVAPKMEEPLDASTSASTALDTDCGASGGWRREDSDAPSGSRGSRGGSRHGSRGGETLPSPMRRKSKRRLVWRLKTKEEYERDEHKKEPTPKKYFNFSSMEQMVTMAPYRSNLSRRQLKEEKERRLCFLQFLSGLLRLNPDLRWTPKQASVHPFILGKAHDPDFQPQADHPVTNFQKAVPPSRCQGQSRPVPMLPKAKLGPPAEGAASARAWEEKNASGLEGEHPQSAPATTREASGDDTGVHMKTEAKALPESALSGLWGHLCMGIPLPDDNPAESYRPPIDKISQHFFRNFMEADVRKRQSESSTEANDAGTASPPKAGAGTSFCSSASSAGSPTGRHGPGPSPLLKAMPSDLRLVGLRPGGAPAGSGPGAPSSARPGSGPSQTPHRGGSAGFGRAYSSRGGSRQSSPWHLPSPMSEMSTASERVNSSQPSGSDSCEEPRHLGSEMAFAFDPDPSVASDTPAGEDPRDPQGSTRIGGEKSAIWESIKYEMSRVELGRDRLPRRMDIQSPGSTGALGTFREAIGMNDNGPVIPFSAAGRHPQSAMRTPPGVAPGATTPNEEQSSQSAGLGVFSMSRSVDGHLGLGFGGGSRRKGKRP